MSQFKSLRSLRLIRHRPVSFTDSSRIFSNISISSPSSISHAPVNVALSLNYYKGKGKGKGLGTYYNAAYDTRTAALYNLGSGS